MILKLGGTRNLKSSLIYMSSPVCLTVAVAGPVLTAMLVEWAGEADWHSPPTLPARRHTRDTDVTKQESIWVIDSISLLDNIPTKYK